jgi:hypothetical protein
MANLPSKANFFNVFGQKTYLEGVFSAKTPLDMFQSKIFKKTFALKGKFAFEGKSGP